MDETDESVLKRFAKEYGEVLRARADFLKALGFLCPTAEEIYAVQERPKE